MNLHLMGMWWCGVQFAYDPSTYKRTIILHFIFCIAITQHHTLIFSYFSPSFLAVDMWAAGVILLSILSRRYPFFKAKDDMEALAQIITVFGSAKMKRMADSIGKCLNWQPFLYYYNYFTCVIEVGLTSTQKTCSMRCFFSILPNFELRV